MSKADIELLFGVQGGGSPSGESAQNIKRQLDNIVGNLNKEPLKIAVELDKGHLKNFQQDLSNLTNFAQSEAKKIRDAYAGIHFPTPPTSPPGGDKDGGGKKKDALLSKDSTEYYKAATKLQKAQTSLRENLRKWTAAADGNSSDDYLKLERQEKRLKALNRLLETGKLSAGQFDKHISKISAEIAKASDNIHLNYENESATKADDKTYDSAITALKELYSVRAKVAKQNADITQDANGEWFSESGQFAGLAEELNRVTKAYADLEKQVQNLPVERQKAFFDAIDAEQIKLDQTLDAKSRKDTAAQEAEDTAAEKKVYDDAVSALKNYYKTRNDVIKQNADLKKDANGDWISESGQFDNLAKRLNEVEQAYKNALKSVQAFSNENKKAFSSEALKEQQKYNEALDAKSRKDTAAKEDAQAAADEETYKKAEAALKSYYSALTEYKKSMANITLADDGSWVSNSEEFDALADRLNRTQAEYAELQAAMASLPADKQQAMFRAMAIEIEKFEQATAGVELKAYRDQLDKVNTLLVKSKATLAKFADAKTGKNSAAYQGLEQTVVVLEELRAELLDGKEALKDFGSRFDQASSDAKQFSTDLELAGDSAKSLKTRISEMLHAMGLTITVADVFRKAIEIGRDMFDVVTEIDTAMTELRKVTEETEATYDRFLTNAEPRARSLGATIAETVSATADFARLGHDIDAASSLADAALVYKNVGDGISDVETASASIISTMQAFQVEASDAMSIVDSFNAVGNNFAVSSAGIGEALLNSAAALHAAGNNIHESIALIAAANTTIQDPGRVGKCMPNSTVMY